MDIHIAFTYQQQILLNKNSIGCVTCTAQCLDIHLRTHCVEVDYMFSTTHVWCHIYGKVIIAERAYTTMRHVYTQVMVLILCGRSHKVKYYQPNTCCNVHNIKKEKQKTSKVVVDSCQNLQISKIAILFLSFTGHGESWWRLKLLGLLRQGTIRTEARTKQVIEKCPLWTKTERGGRREEETREDKNVKVKQ